MGDMKAPGVEQAKGEMTVAVQVKDRTGRDISNEGVSEDGGDSAPVSITAGAVDATGLVADGEGASAIEGVDPFAATQELMSHEKAHAEVFYQTLLICRARSDEREIAKAIRALPQMLHSTRTAKSYLRLLGKSGALRVVSLNPDTAGDGPVATSARIQTDMSPAPAAPSDPGGEVPSTKGRGESIASPVTTARGSCAWALTEAGERIIELYAPANRLGELLAREPRYTSLFAKVLEFCHEQRTRVEIDRLLGGEPAMRDPKIYASFFTEHLERADGLMWENGWKTTKYGEECLRGIDG